MRIWQGGSRKVAENRSKVGYVRTAVGGTFLSLNHCAIFFDSELDAQTPLNSCAACQASFSFENSVREAAFIALLL